MIVLWHYHILLILLINIKVFHIQGALSSSSSSSSENDIKYFYIYEWPKELDDVWPPANATLHHKSGYNHDFRLNHGAGKLIDKDVGLFQTWQFSLYKNIMARLRVSPYRTRDPKKATSFIIPFDLGVHSYIDHLTGEPRLAAPHGRLAGRLLREHCNGDDGSLFWKNQGHDHFLIFSITAYQMVGMMVKEFFMFICQNCTVITIETSPTKTAIPGRTRKAWYAAPYPSSFHWYEGIQTLPWKLPDSKDHSKYPLRDILVLFIGSKKPSQPNSRALRQTLFSQCKTEDRCIWHETAHACNGVVNATNTMLLFRRAQYCPAPAGDSITRKSIFDALVAGCVPVIFSRATISQYSWHVSDKDIQDISVYIPMNDINEGGANFIEVLKSISPEELRKKQEAIARIAPRLQYSVVPEHIKEGDTWTSPFKDAGDVVIEKILDRKTVHPIHGYPDAELLQQHEEQKKIMEFHEDYAALKGTNVRKNKVLKAVPLLENGQARTLTKSLKICKYPLPEQ